MRRTDRTKLARAAAALVLAAATVLGTASTASAVFGGERMLFRGPREPTEPKEVKKPEPVKERTPEVRLTEREARPLVESYYASHGQWAGQYVIDDIPRVRFVQHGPDRIHAHVRYRYRCVIGRCGGAQQTGYDQRVFYFERQDGKWKIIWMGGYMSADMQ